MGLEVKTCEQVALLYFYYPLFWYEHSIFSVEGPKFSTPHPCTVSYIFWLPQGTLTWNEEMVAFSCQSTIVQCKIINKKKYLCQCSIHACVIIFTIIFPNRNKYASLPYTLVSFIIFTIIFPAFVHLYYFALDHFIWLACYNQWSADCWWSYFVAQVPGKNDKEGPTGGMVSIETWHLV